MLAAKRVGIWIAALALFALSPAIFLISWCVIYGNRYTRTALNNRIYDFYGYDEVRKRQLISQSNEKWGEFWSNLTKRYINGNSNNRSKNPSNAVSHKDDNRHIRVGFCQGANVETPNFRSSHPLYKCGNCNHAGCSDMNCANRSFRGTNCQMCNHMANYKN